MQNSRKILERAIEFKQDEKGAWQEYALEHALEEWDEADKLLRSASKSKRWPVKF